MAACLIILYLLGIPALVMHLSHRWAWIDKVSPVTVMYIIGLVVANSRIFTLVPSSDNATGLISSIGNIAVPLAIPMMLMSCHIDRTGLRLTLKAALTGFLSVLIVIVAGSLIFQFAPSEQLSAENDAQICAVATGIYTGGIPNMGAIKQAVGMSDELYLYISTCDLVVTGLYLVFLIFFGKRFFRHILPYGNHREQTVESAETETYNSPFAKQHLRGSLFIIGLTIAIAAISYIVATLPFHGETNMTVLILMLTTLSVVASLFKPVNRQTQAFDMGLYCVYVFSLAIASMCDFRSMNLANCLPILLYITVVIFGSLLLQILFARLLKLDGDIVMVASVALVNSPPFVPMVAALLKNRDVVVIGVTIGLLGYIAGNYLGIGIYHLMLLL